MSIFTRNKPSGVLYVTKSDVDGEIGMFLEASEHPIEIANKKYVTFKVKVIKPNSQK